VHPRIEHLAAALAYSGGSHTLDDIATGIYNHSLQYWPGPDSVIVTEIVVTPQQKTLNFFLAGGSMAELRAMTPDIEQWAREHGCTLATLIGRKGWERTWLTQSGGYKATHTVFEKAL
jgi:hypothetical protein